MPEEKSIEQKLEELNKLINNLKEAIIEEKWNFIFVYLFVCAVCLGLYVLSESNIIMSSI